MVCNKCGGKSKIIDTVNVEADNETYRKHKCVDCGRVFYTTEIEIAPDDLYIDNWYDNYRKKKGDEKTHAQKELDKMIVKAYFNGIDEFVKE